ncbi:hypothetical protein LFT45_23045 (plasmid) [Arthrobacter sp. FW305-BF8]|uniref:hypothetical protein n=1 Tax=Arthrobacter sp. FW305-BF8 TaxID=2879617 RepID=UPI001F1B72E3|nr:hypothetical protein [Arthrobacter sp. FW305-BF8]UKA56754.1 hypothetical protein LFT45_23045 [Arthrobacter sp. FW305-BF8]
MNAMNGGLPADFEGMTGRILGILPLMVAGLAVLCLVIWLAAKWTDARRDNRNFRKYVEVTDEVRRSNGGKLSDAEVSAQAFGKYLDVAEPKLGNNRKAQR